MNNPYFIPGIVDIVIGTAEITLAIYFFWTHSRNRIRQFYGLFILGVGVWVLGDGLFESLPRQFSGLLFVNQVIFFSAVVIASGFLVFSWEFPYRTHEVKRWHDWVALLPIPIFFVLLFFTKLIVSGISLDSRGILHSIYQSWYPVFGWWFLIYWFWGVGNLIVKQLKAEGLHRQLLIIFLFGVYGSSIVGVFTNLLLPLIWGVQDFGWLGPMASVIWLSITSYIIIRK